MVVQTHITCLVVKRFEVPSTFLQVAVTNSYYTCIFSLKLKLLFSLLRIANRSGLVVLVVNSFASTTPVKVEEMATRTFHGGVVSGLAETLAFA